MLKGRGREPRGGNASAPFMRPVNMAQPRTLLPQRPQVKPEPDYEVVEFPSDQYVNAKLQPPPPPPPRPPTGHPAQAGASCGLCGGGGARVRCTECGRRALCASCDDMYHRHPKRRHHQRQALSQAQLSEDRPPLPPKVAAPVPPPRRHKMSASPKPPTPVQDPRRATLTHASLVAVGIRPQPSSMLNQAHTFHVQNKMPSTPPNHLGSMPFLNTMPHQGAPSQNQLHQMQTNTLGHMNSGWNRPRASLQGFNMPQMHVDGEPWESREARSGGHQSWGRGMRRGASVLELGGGAPCPGCAHCGPVPWRYGSCATLDQPWPAPAPAWPGPAPAPSCCVPHYPHAHQHPPQTPQPYRRAESRAVSRAASRAGSRAGSPAASTRSRASRRTRHRTPSPPISSDADSESESEEEPPPPPAARRSSKTRRDSAPIRDPSPIEPTPNPPNEESLGPIPPAPVAPWQCEHCTYVNEPHIRVCAVCCRTPTAAPRVIAEVTSDMNRLEIASDRATPARRESPRVEVRAEKSKHVDPSKPKKERASTGCGPSPPREQSARKQTPRTVTPSRERNGADVERPRTRHDMAVGPSPPRDARDSYQEATPSNKTLRVSPYRESRELVNPSPQRHSVSVGPSPPREARHSVSVGPSPPREMPHSVSVGPSPPRETPNSVSVGPSPLRETRHSVSAGPSSPRDPSRFSPMTIQNFQKKSAGTSPPRGVPAEGRSTAKTNTGTSPPPQSISTQTYEEPTWERPGSAARSRSRRRFRDEARRERSHSRHSLSSDTRESERSVRTAGAGWEWREREPSPGPARGRLARRASHLDLYRVRPHRRDRDDYYGSEAASPEPPSGRAMSMEALSRPRDAVRGLELARLLADAEKLGYNATEVQVALAQSPSAPLEWLRTRWAGLVGAVQGAVARLAGGSQLGEREARAALTRHRGAVWPAVTDCVDALRTQTESSRVSSAARVRGRVWGSPAGADDDAPAPRVRAGDSSDEYDPYPEEWGTYEPPTDPPPAPAAYDTELVARKLRSLLLQAGIPSIDENLLLRGLLADGARAITPASETKPPERVGRPAVDLIQSENDFIDAYNALTRASPLPNIDEPTDGAGIEPEKPVSNAKTEPRTVKDDERQIDATNVNGNKKVQNKKIPNIAHKKETNRTTLKPEQHSVMKPEQNPGIFEPNVSVRVKNEPKKAKIKILQSENQINNNDTIDHFVRVSSATTTINVRTPQRNEIKSPPLLTDVPPPGRPAEEKSNNLNDIVDNTQKLIQQMKEEINSDINSLDDGHAQTSQSEHESSSNDEREEESSYSASEADTEEMTSDEKEISSEYDDDEETGRHSRSNATFPNRTSSEDNEQFEEALDNLDNQIEDVKHTNIEILDSIARSLQEEHTLSIETNESKPVMEQSVKEAVNIPMNKEDSNNNLFSTVNSFEEIYAELNSAKTSQNLKDVTVLSPIISQQRISPPKEPIILLSKYAINELSLKIVTPTKLLISENKEPMFNAVVGTIEEESKVENTKENQVEVETAVVDDNKEQIVEERSSLESSSTSQVQIPSNGITESLTSYSNDTNHVLETNEPMKEEATLVQTEITIVEANQSEHNMQRKSVEKVTENDNNNSIKTATVKSSIPKPIKTQGIKAKVDKLSPKLIVSKVPIRRASVKQYPAPAPPKFGNVQSGHVKQLQTKVFNSDTIPAKLKTPLTIDVKPSTSTATLTKKKQAPVPPIKQEVKQSTPPKSPPKEKRSNYFRETCRTEDEWTESDSEDSQSQIVKVQIENKEEPVSPPSPPPPLTLRRVSGQIIDLANVQLPEGSPERQARMLLAAGALESWEQAQLAVELVGRGAVPPAALLAALECTDLAAALAYLHQDCELCASRLPEHEMVSMLRCTHRCCRECARLYFTVQITERSIADCVCPYCKLPELENLPEDAWLEYFAHLDILLKTLLETDVHELFQRKLRDRTLALDPNFRWCMECSSGFFVHPKQKKLRCPECRSVSCASCRKPWNSNHEGLSCEQYAAWLEDNDPEVSAAAVQQHLRENGLECPRCRFKYSLSRGGCMHFTCTQCKYEFCYGCGKPFTMGARCGLSEYCAKLGLHAHHPRNCLFYLRDKEPHELQTLLQMNNVTYETQPAAGSSGRCPIQLQRETPTGLVDGICGSETPNNYAGLCKPHYVEYLAGLARALDPLPIMDVAELVAELRRRALPLPERGPWDTDPVYAGMCAEIVKEKIPLD